MGTKATIIIKQNGEKIKDHYYNYPNDETLEFYFLKNECETKAKYPVYTSGKCKGDVAFKKDGTLVLSQELYNAIILANGYLHDGRKVVKLVMPDDSLTIVYYKKVHYMGRFLELLFYEMNKRYSRHLNSLAAIKEAYFQGVLKWEKIQTRSTLEIRVNPSMHYKYVQIEGEQLDCSNELDKLLEYYKIPDGDSTLDFKMPIHKISEIEFSYNIHTLVGAK